MAPYREEKAISSIGRIGLHGHAQYNHCEVVRTSAWPLGGTTIQGWSSPNPKCQNREVATQTIRIKMEADKHRGNA